MTIALSIKVHDGVVLAADSATTMSIADGTGKQQIVNVYNNANKVFNLVKGLPVGALTFGAGNIGHPSIATLAKDLRRRFTEGEPEQDWHIDRKNYTIEQIAVALRKFIYEDTYLPVFGEDPNSPHLGFQIAGYSAGAALADVWTVLMGGGKCDPPKQIRKIDEFGTSWNGEPEAISRLLLGMPSGLGDGLLAIGLPNEALSAALASIQAHTEIGLAEAPMPVQDAIDLAEFLVHTTCMFTRFKRGAATVGGPIEIAAITKHEGFKWVKRKHYFDSNLNPGE